MAWICERSNTDRVLYDYRCREKQRPLFDCSKQDRAHDHTSQNAPLTVLVPNHTSLTKGGIQDTLDISHAADTVLLQVRGGAWGQPKGLIDCNLHIQHVHRAIAVDIT